MLDHTVAGSPLHLEPRILHAEPLDSIVAWRLPLATQPDYIEELIRIADQVKNMPREWLDSREDLFHALHRVGGRIRQIAGRIERIEPLALPKASRHALPRRRLPVLFAKTAQLALF